MSQSTPEANAHSSAELDRRIGENSRNIAEVISRLNELEEIIEKQERIIEDLRDGMTTDRYEAMSAKERRQRVKQALRKKADKQNGASAVDYREIVALFDQEIPNATAYKLMEQIPSKAEAFEYEERANGNNRLTYDREREDGVFTSK